LRFLTRVVLMLMISASLRLAGGGQNKNWKMRRQKLEATAPT